MKSVEKHGGEIGVKEANRIRIDGARGRHETGECMG